jgi:hypothetical protein
MSESWERGRKAEGTFQKVMFESGGRLRRRTWFTLN